MSDKKAILATAGAISSAALISGSSLLMKVGLNDIANTATSTPNTSQIIPDEGASENGHLKVAAGTIGNMVGASLLTATVLAARRRNTGNEQPTAWGARLEESDRSKEVISR